MNKQIILTHDGQEYTLAFTRDSIATMERMGFDISQMRNKPMLTIPALFAGAFIAHHRFAKQDTIDAIYDKIGNKSELLNALSEMYIEPVQTLVDDSESAEGNVSWSANW